jgi:GTP-binding protein
VRCEAEFVTSAATVEAFPRESLPELAVIGRSNVGKSSLINALVARKIARTSAAPGKTRLANVYRVAPAQKPAFHLVDLPGYGFAPGGAKTAQAFEAVTQAYFDRVAEPPRTRERTAPVLAGVLLLVDSRHPDLEADRRAWAWLGERGLSRRVVATKVDKLTRAERQRHLAVLNRLYEGPVPAVSAVSGEGLEELWKLIVRLLRQPVLDPARQSRPSR